MEELILVSTNSLRKYLDHTLHSPLLSVTTLLTCSQLPHGTDKVTIRERDIAFQFGIGGGAFSHGELRIRGIGGTREGSLNWPPSCLFLQAPTNSAHSR